MINKLVSVENFLYFVLDNFILFCRVNLETKETEVVDSVKSI